MKAQLILKMFFNKIIMLAIVLMIFCVFQSINAGCVCNEQGSDHCAGCTDRRIIRPRPKYYESGNINLPPIGDNCWCSKQLIEPATLPKPCEKGKKKKCSKGDSYTSESYDTPSYAPKYPSMPYAAPSYVKDDTLPADPVSISLAVKAGKAIEVPEFKLAYGFIQKPVDGMHKEQFSNIPEENLFKLKNDVIVLNKPAQQPVEKFEEEIIEEEEEEYGTATNDEDIPKLTYKQLGYETERYRNPKFRKVSYSAYAAEGDDDDDEGYGKRKSYGSGKAKPVYAKVSVDCGFKPGRITSYKKKNQEDSYENL